MNIMSNIERDEFEKWYTENFGGVAKVFKGLRRGDVYPQESMVSVNTAWAAWKAARAQCGQPQPAVPEWMRGLSENLAAQNNRITQDPLFVVFQKREIVVDEEFDHDRISWGNGDGEADDRVQDHLNEMYDDIDGDFWREDEIELTDEEIGTGTYRRVALKEVDQFVTACFTEVGASDYLKANGHNLTRPHIYVTSLYRNEEMERLREWLLSTPHHAPG